MSCGCHSHNGFLLSSEDSELEQQLSLEGLLPRGSTDRVDKSGSVSALVEVEVDAEYVPDHIELNRRLIHGS